jgi:aspartyl-tRNA(Asn)/glutamyl-tRNA(Gln) amidotransferase subunit C
MISREEVEHIAGLARLELAEEEIKKMQEDLAEILDYFNVLKKAPKLQKIVKGKGNLRATRIDEIKPKEPGLSEKLISAAPDKKDDYIKVKTIL